MVCKLAEYLESDSGHELPKQLNACEVLSWLPVSLAPIYDAVFIQDINLVKDLLQVKKSNGIQYEMGYLHQKRVWLWKINRATYFVIKWVLSKLIIGNVLFF